MLSNSAAFILEHKRDEAHYFAHFDSKQLEFQPKADHEFRILARAGDVLERDVRGRAQPCALIDAQAGDGEGQRKNESSNTPGH